MNNGLYIHICDALHALVTFVQFKKGEEHPWMNNEQLMYYVNVMRVTFLKNHQLYIFFISKFIIIAEASLVSRFTLIEWYALSVTSGKGGNVGVGGGVASKKKEFQINILQQYDDTWISIKLLLPWKYF